MNKKTILKTWLVISVVLMVSSAQAGPFPGAGDDSFSSAGVFKVTLSPAFGGGTMVIWVDGTHLRRTQRPSFADYGPVGHAGRKQLHRFSKRSNIRHFNRILSARVQCGRWFR